MPTTDTLSEWLSRWTRNPLGSARKGLNPFGVALLWHLGMWMLCGPAACTATAGCGLRSFEPALVELRSVFAKTCRAGTRFTCHPELCLPHSRYYRACLDKEGLRCQGLRGVAHFLHASKSTKQGRQQDNDSKPVGFEPTRGDPIGLAGRRLSRSAKVSCATQPGDLRNIASRWARRGGHPLPSRLQCFSLWCQRMKVSWRHDGWRKTKRGGRQTCRGGMAGLGHCCWQVLPCLLDTHCRRVLRFKDPKIEESGEACSCPTGESSSPAEPLVWFASWKNFRRHGVRAARCWTRKSNGLCLQGSVSNSVRRDRDTAPVHAA